MLINTIGNNIYNKSELIDTFNNNYNSKQIIYNELVEFNSNLDFPDYAEIRDNNIYQVYLNIYKTLDEKCIIKFDFDSNFYPLVPPKIQWMAPKISKEDYSAIINCSVFGGGWSQLITIPWLFTQIKNKLLERESTKNSKFFSKDITFVDYQETLIVGFAKTTGRFICPNPIEISVNSIKKPLKTSSTHMKKGTGYGTGPTDKVNYLDIQKNIISEKTDYIDKIYRIKNITSSNKSFLFNILIKEIMGITLLELIKYPILYYKYFKIIKNIATKELFNNLDCLEEIKLDFTNLIENINISDDPALEFKIYNKIHPIVSDLIKLIDIDIDIDKTELTPKISTNTLDEYCTIMKPLQFSYNDISKCKFAYHNITGPQRTPKQMTRIAQEISSLQKSLPLNKNSCVWIRWDKKQLNKMQFMISGPQDTPYQDGLFLFDCYFPHNYPLVPPLINLQTTGNGTVRFNPNLYENGKVCLSLLGTWTGSNSEKWNSKTSTMLQVIVSIQSLILNEEPYFNEPVYQHTMGTPTGIKHSLQYNQNIRSATSVWAINNMINNPPSGFEDIVKNHFKLKKNNLIKTLQHWENIADTIYREHIQKVLKNIMKL